MLNTARIAISIAIVFGAAPVGLAGAMQEASNHASQYGNPADTPNGPFSYVDTYGVPPATQRRAQQPRRPPRGHDLSRP
jgi:hypothetical protein